MASARRISGSASARRFVSFSCNCAKLLRSKLATVWVFGSVGLLVDGQRAAHQRLGLRQTVRGLQQRPTPRLLR